MSNLETSQRIWEQNAAKDPLWVVCSDAAKKGGRWNEAEFFQTGANEIRVVMEHLRGLGLSPAAEGVALDFGCGAGRLTQALASQFGEAVGVDISPTMIEQAKRYNKFAGRCQYLCNSSDTLPVESHKYDFIYSSIALQHIELPYARKYIREFLRVLKPSGQLVIQLADRRKHDYVARLKETVRIRTRLGAVLKFLGLIDYKPFRFAIHCLGETHLREILAGTRCHVVDVQFTNSIEPNFNGNLRYLASEPTNGYISKQYVIAREPIA